MSQKSEFFLRPYQVTDAPQVVEMINVSAARTVGMKQAVVDGMGHIRLARYIPPASDIVVVTNAQMDVVGFAYCANVEQAVICQVGGAVHPDFWGRGIGLMLVAWAERQALALAQQVPPGIRTVLQTNLYSVENEAIQLFMGCGFMKVREWAHLGIDLDGLRPLPALPDGLVLRAMDLENDWERVGPAMEAAYADHWGTLSETFVEAEADPQLETANVPEDDSYSNAPGFCFMVLAEETVVGGILCNAKLVERAGTGRVGSLFVRPAYRRQGIGCALMTAAFNAFWQNGIKRIILDTDAASFTNAPHFYANLGMFRYRREYLYEKEIRPGREVRRLER